MEVVEVVEVDDEVDDVVGVVDVELVIEVVEVVDVLEGIDVVDVGASGGVSRIVPTPSASPSRAVGTTGNCIGGVPGGVGGSSTELLDGVESFTENVSLASTTVSALTATPMVRETSPGPKVMEPAARS